MILINRYYLTSWQWKIFHLQLDIRRSWSSLRLHLQFRLAQDDSPLHVSLHASLCPQLLGEIWVSNRTGSWAFLPWILFVSKFRIYLYFSLDIAYYPYIAACRLWSCDDPCKRQAIFYWWKIYWFLLNCPSLNPLPCFRILSKLTLKQVSCTVSRL